MVLIHNHGLQPQKTLRFFITTSSLGILKKLRFKELLVLGISKFKESLGVMKKPKRTQQFLGDFFPKIRNCSYVMKTY